MVRVLHSVSNMDRAGIETMLMNYYRHMNRDKIQFDFLCNKMKPGAYDDEIRKMGGKIYYSPGLNPIKYPLYLKYMKQLFLKNPEYHIIEAHNGALGNYALYAAKKIHVPVRIFHAHGASITKNWKWPIKMICKQNLNHNINYSFTCGIAAAECYYGKNAVLKNQFELIPNAIDVDRFIFNLDIRDNLRNKYGLQGKHIVGHVGRFSSQKNHDFLIDVFREVSKRDPLAHLVLLGEGELFKKIQDKVKNLNLMEKVIFVGNVGNANEWYSVFDTFVLPSIWEGLPVVGVEAQAADLPCVFSSNVTREIGLSKKTKFLELDKSLTEWVEVILKNLEIKDRYNASDLITKNHYNIVIEAKKLENRYLELDKEYNL